MRQAGLFLRRNLLLSAALVLLFAALGLGAHINQRQAVQGFTFNPGQGDSGPVFAIGDVNDVLWGHVSQAARDTYWPANGIIGFGAGTVGPLAGLGEAFFANGYAFVRQTDNGTHNYFQTVSDQEFRTPFSVFVMEDLKGDGSGTYEAGPGSPAISLTRLYENIHKSLGGSPFCYYGLTEYEHVDAIAVSKAPIYGEALFGESAGGYYTQPNFHVQNAYGLTFGCAANFSQVAEPELFEKLSRALYVNPKDDTSRTTLQVHSHLLTLQKSVKEIDQIQPNTALDVYHLLSTSKISRISVNVFRIHKSDRLIEPQLPGMPATTSSSLTGNNGNSIRYSANQHMVLYCTLLASLLKIKLH